MLAHWQTHIRKFEKFNYKKRIYKYERWWIIKKLYGKQLKKLINDNISDNDIVCFGEKGDKLGRFDRKIIGIEKRNFGFDNDNDDDTYKVIITESFCENGAMKFWK